jgi:hypothetical protein
MQPDLAVVALISRLNSGSATTFLIACRRRVVIASGRFRGPAMPASFTNTSSPPRCAAAAFTKALLSAVSPMSARIAGCGQAASASASTSRRKTEAPRAAKLSAMTRLMPPTPALMATLSPVSATGSSLSAPCIPVSSCG